MSDLVLDWHEELDRLRPEWNRLPAEARRAVVEVVGRFLAEDRLGAAEDRRRALLRITDDGVPGLRFPPAV